MMSHTPHTISDTLTPSIGHSPGEVMDGRGAYWKYDRDTNSTWIYLPIEGQVILIHWIDERHLGRPIALHRCIPLFNYGYMGCPPGYSEITTHELFQRLDHLNVSVDDRSMIVAFCGLVDC